MCVKKMLEQGKNVLEAKVLVMGATFKEDVSDIRNSKVVDVIRELDSFSVQVDIVDPHAEPAEFAHEYSFDLAPGPAEGTYDAIIVAVNHKEYLDLAEAYFKSLMADPDKGVVMDLKGMYAGRINDMEYWSL